MKHETDKTDEYKFLRDFLSMVYSMLKSIQIFAQSFFIEKVFNMSQHQFFFKILDFIYLH